MPPTASEMALLFSSQPAPPPPPPPLPPEVPVDAPAPPDPADAVVRPVDEVASADDVVAPDEGAWIDTSPPHATTPRDERPKTSARDAREKFEVMLPPRWGTMPSTL